MAKTISDEQMKLSIIINGNEAQKELFDLEKSTRKLTEENKALGLQKKLLIKQGKEETAEYKALTLTMKANTAEINGNKLKQQELQKQIGITSLTMHQLTQKAHLLKMSLQNAIPGSEAYRRYTSELEQVNARLGELRGRSRTAQSSIASLADTFNRYQGMAIAVIGALTGVVLSVQKIIDINGKLADAQSDVMKTTGMTKVEVDELTKSFGLLQTRTSRIDLLGIAEQGGRIGIAKAELSDFVNVMNKANVSLGDSFTGGAEEVANKLGKIKFLFQETKDLNVDQAYNSIGSAINDLGANGVASEANIADFTTRIGSLTDVLKPTIQETLALGTAFEESGIESEVSARAYGIFMKQASTETAKFAKVMGITQGEVEAMINTNPLEFMLKFSEGMKGMNATDTAKTLDALGISADGANKVIGAMGNNTARFRELIDLSNKSFGEGTSLINEYEIKNNNLAATLEKISKTVSGWFSSETFIKWLGGAVEGLAKLIGATEDADGTATAWRNTLVFTAKIIAIVTAAMITNVGWQKLVALWTTRNTEATLLYNIASKARAFADGVAMVASQAYAAVTMLLTGNIKGASQAFRVMTATMMTTPWGFILGAVAAVAAAYVLFTKELSEAAVIQKTLSDVHLKATESISQEKTELELLTKIARDETISKEKRLKAIEKLNQIIPDYIGQLTLENIKTAEGIGILKQYTAELYANARAKASHSKFDELAKERLEVENKTAGYYRKTSTFGFLSSSQFDKMGSRKDMEDYVKNQFKGTDKEWQKDYVDKMITISGLDDKEKALKSIDDQMKALEGEVLKSTINDLGKPNNNVGSGGSGFKPIGGDGKVGNGKDGKKDNNTYINNELKLTEDLYNIRKKGEEMRISLMADGFEKDLALEKLNSSAKIQELTYQNTSFENLQTKLNADLLVAEKNGDTKQIASIKNQQSILTESQKANNELICYEEEIQKKRIGIIEEKAAKDSIEKSKAAFDQAKIIRETKFNEEYAALGTNEKAKAKLKKEFEAKELEEETKFLNELIVKLNTIVGKGKLDGIDLSLLTPEQTAFFTAEAAKAGLSLSDLIKKKNELAGKETGFNILQGQGTDIFGFSPEQWDSAFSNFDTAKEKIEAVSTVLGGLQNAFSMYSSFVEANSKRDLQNLDKKQSAERTKLKNQLDRKQITQAQYDKKVAKLDAEKEKAQAEAEYKRAKNEKIGALFSIGVNTAIGVMKAVAASPLTGGLPWSAIIGGMGLLQAGMVLAQPLPAKGHEAGLYPEYVKRSQDGRVFQSKYQGKTRSGLVSDTSHFLVAENGPEMIIDNKAWREMNPAVKDSLIRELNGIKGFEKGLYNQETKRIEVPAASSGVSSSDTQMMQMMMALVAENTATMKELKDKVFLGVVSNKDLKSMGYLQEGINAANELREKSKR